MAPSVGGRGTKRVTGRLDERVKALIRGEDAHRLAGCVSSGSEHEEGGLSGFVDGFFFSELEEEQERAGFAGSDGEGIWSPPPVSVVARVWNLLKPSAEDNFRRDLVANVAAAVERLSSLRSNRLAFLTAVMNSLRDSGYNAGVCEAKWDRDCAAAAGSYEYIDVVRPQPEAPPAAPSRGQQRYIVDVEFAAEFEIARPTGEYGRLAAELPRVYVGRPEELKQLLRLLAGAAKRSLQSREMHVPPWRKGRYLQAKWLGPYSRTLNPVPPATPPPVAPPPSFTADRGVKCRCVGFHPAATQLVIPAATRTR